MAMKVECRIDCSPNEMRRLLGRPDLSPVYQGVMVMVERWLVQQVARIEPDTLRPQPAAGTPEPPPAG